MKLKSYYLILLLLITSFSFISCNNNEDSATSRIQLKLVDAEGDYDKVLVNIIDVKYNRSDDDEGWVSFEGFTLPITDDPENRVDLTELIAGNSLVLTDEDIDSGMLSQVRLILGDGNAIVLEDSEDEIPLKTPSAQQSGLKLHLDTELVAGYSYTFVLDWDVQKSIVKAGNSGNYNLKPVIRVTAEVNSGTISGTIADADDGLPIVGATVYVYKEGETDAFTSTFTSDEGLFMLQGLPEGNYTLEIMNTDYDNLVYPDVTADPNTIEVMVGEETSVGTILITKTL